MNTMQLVCFGFQFIRSLFAAFHGSRIPFAIWVFLNESSRFYTQSKHHADTEILGYAPVVVNDTYIGGQTRQYGNQSFTRVYESGHEVPAYQPETAYKIFMRSLFNFDIATGNISTTENPDYSTSGPSAVFNITSEPIVDPGSVCYVLDSETCTAEQWESVSNGTALVRNWIVIDANSTFLFPDLANGTNQTGGNTTVPTSPVPSATSSDAPIATGAALRRFGLDTVNLFGVEISLFGNALLAVAVSMAVLAIQL